MSYELGAYEPISGAKLSENSGRFCAEISGGGSWGYWQLHLSSCLKECYAYSSISDLSRLKTCLHVKRNSRSYHYMVLFFKVKAVFTIATNSESVSYPSL